MSDEDNLNFWGRVIRGYGRWKKKRSDKRVEDKELNDICKKVELEAYQDMRIKKAVEKGKERATNKGGTMAKVSKMVKAGQALNKGLGSAFGAPPTKKGEKRSDPLNEMFSSGNDKKKSNDDLFKF